MRPRVLVLSTYYHPVVGGVETHARQLVSRLHRSGFEVQVVTKRVSREGPRDMAADCDHWLAAPSGETPLIQQIHIVAAHAICGLVESNLFGGKKATSPA